MKENFIESALEKFSSSLYKGLSRAADETAVARARAKSSVRRFSFVNLPFEHSKIGMPAERGDVKKTSQAVTPPALLKGEPLR